MKVQSTGLGKTVMVASFKELLHTQFNDKRVIQMTMEATEPLHWTIKVYMEPRDVREAIGLGLKPSVIWKALIGLIFGRFSLFPEARKQTEEQKPISPATPSVPPEPPAPPSQDKASSPLARLKG